MESLGFTVNKEKSQSQATQCIELLGFIVDSRDKVMPTHVKQIKVKCKRALERNQVTLRTLAHIVGVLVATQLAVLLA